MKRYLSVLLALVLLLPGCGGKQEETTGYTARDILQAMLDRLDEREEADALVWYLERQDVADYLAAFYELEDLSWTDGAVVRMEGARAFELAALQVDEGEVETVSAALQDYLLDRQGSFTGYFPDQADLADRGLVLTRGQWAALIVCQDPEEAKAAFESCFGAASVHSTPDPSSSVPDTSSGPEKDPASDLRPDVSLRDPEAGPRTDVSPEGPEADPGPSVSRPEDPARDRVPFSPPGQDDMSLCDTSAILAAWRSGEDGALSEEDKAVLDAAKRVFEEHITSDMSDYEKELALYSWLVRNVDYDPSHYEPQGAPRTSYQPYGPLIEGKGVCLGFAETFRLFMDMAGIECITVTGAAFHSREDHAWNMVRLNGEWYCADPTWDDSSRPPDFIYFNVTSDWMARTDHQWDYASVPEATAEDFGQG